MSIKRKVGIVISVCVLTIIGIYIYKLFTAPIVITDKIQAIATMDLQIYLSDAIVLAKVASDNDEKTVTFKDQTSNGEKTYKKRVTDTQLEIKEVYKGDITKGSKITYRGDYGYVKGLESYTQTDNPNFKLGEECILFLKKDKESNTYYLPLGPQSKFVYDKEKGKYVAEHLEFEDAKAEIERYNNTPEDERDLAGAGKGSIDDI